MIIDYSHRYVSMAAKNQPQQRQRQVQAGQLQGLSGPWIMKKTVGALVVITLLVGLGAIFWCGRQIRTALDEIGRGENFRQEITTRNLKLKTQRDHLLTREQIEAAANRLGLYRPTSQQIRKS